MERMLWDSLKRAKKIQNYVQDTGSQRGCLEVAAASLGGTVKKCNVKSPVSSLKENAFYHLKPVSKATQTRSVTADSINLLFECPNAALQRFGLPRKKGIRGTIITLDGPQSDRHHALAIIPRHCLGIKMEGELRQDESHVVVDVTFPELIRPVSRTDFVNFLNEELENGTKINFYHVVRDKK